MHLQGERRSNAQKIVLQDSPRDPSGLARKPDASRPPKACAVAAAMTMKKDMRTVNSLRR